METTIIQLREADCGSRTNGDFEAVLPVPINIGKRGPGRDQGLVHRHQDHRIHQSITLAEDVHATIGTVLYGFDHDAARTGKIAIDGAWV